MSNLWWLQEGWTDTLCVRCGTKIWPEGDPDTGFCYSCFTANVERQKYEDQMRREYEAEMAAEYERYIKEQHHDHKE